MTGPEHYEAAGLWLFKAERESARGTAETPESCAAIAQAHATLALAAATALNPARDGYSDPDRAAWRKAAGTDGP